MPTRKTATTIRNPAWYGWIPDLPDQRDHLYASVHAAPKKLPTKVDLRKTCSAIEDQGQLGSCTANALVGALEFLERKQKQRVQNLSRLFVYYNERVIEHSVKTDAGAMLRDGIKTLAKQGVCTEKLWPYTIKKFADKPTTACYAQANPHSPRAAYDLANTYMVLCQEPGNSHLVPVAFEALQHAATMPGANILPDQGLLLLSEYLHREPP